MNRQLTTSLLLITSLISFSSFSANKPDDNNNLSDVFSVDRIVSNDVELNFTNDGDIQPKISDFIVLNYVLMSNEKGDRRATFHYRDAETALDVLKLERKLLAHQKDALEAGIEPTDYMHYCEVLAQLVPIREKWETSSMLITQGSEFFKPHKIMRENEIGSYPR